jgi:hypothetical protein
VVSVVIDNVAAERPRLSQEFVEGIRRYLAAPILGAGLVDAELRTLGSVYAEDADVLAVDLDRVAVDHAGAADNPNGWSHERQEQ